jgi:hypothetical protein
MSKGTQKQVVYFFPRRELLVGKTVTRFSAMDTEAAISAIVEITTSAAGGRRR